jgi:hypothetical protein
MATTNGGPGQGAAGAAPDQPQLTVVAQYIKDFSFENPNAPKSLGGRQEQPQIGIQINVGATPLSDTDIEVVIKLEGKAESGRCFPNPKRSAREFEPACTDRVSAAAVPIRARDRRNRRSQWRFPTASS